ncbi:hypothetical protein [Paenibacillus dakarensis]|uniref:hypothetical protein n=1 Tax=Paenibacillus dakarensis TaxID=1527293 RepID=UPI0006D5B3B8|nr:hypothetical protein [Paenibacillus dakarensis]
MDYKDLPERLDERFLKGCFQELLTRIVNSQIEEIEALIQLKELTIRQWYTFELLNSEIRAHIDKWLIQIWHPLSEEKANLITFIVINLGLICTYEHLLEEYKHLQSESYQTIIKEMISELKGNVEDPYQALREYIII